MNKGLAALLALCLWAGTLHAQEAMCPVGIAWERMGELKQAVGGPAAGVLRGKFIVAGGTSWLDGETKIWSNEAHVFDLRNDAWEALPPIPAKSGYSCAVAFKKALYVFGGQSAKDTNGRSVWRLGRTGDSWDWQTFVDLPENLANMQAALIGSTAYLVAGDAGQGVPAANNAVWKVDLGRAHPEWKKCAPLPGAMRTGVATTACSGKLYSFGGGILDACVYDPERDQWERIADLPYPSQWSWAVSFKDRYILMPGGFVAKEKTAAVPAFVHMDANGFIADVLVYDTRTGKYSFSNPLPKGVIDYGLARNGDQIYLAGGEDCQKHRESWLMRGTLSLRK